MAIATPASRLADRAPAVPVHAEPLGVLWERTGSRPGGLTPEEVGQRRGAPAGRIGRLLVCGGHRPLPYVFAIVLRLSSIARAVGTVAAPTPVDGCGPYSFASVRRCSTTRSVVAGS